MGVGIDIGSKTIKIVELDKQGSGWGLKGSGVIGYNGNPPEHAKEDKELVPLAEALKKLYKEARISGKDVALALPEPQVYTRTMKFPLLTDKEISSAVKWEAEQYIPIPVTEAVFQHQILERRESATPPEVIVLLVASPKTVVEKYIKVVQMAGLNVAVVETELISLLRSLAPPSGTVLIVDFGAKSTDIGVSNNGQLNFSRSIPTAGDALTRAVSQSLGIEVAQAEEYKKTYGLSAMQLEGKIKGVLDPVLQMVTDEIKKAIHFYKTEEKGDAPNSIILSGGTSGMPEVVSVLTKYLNMEVVIGNPFQKVNLDANTQNSLSSYAPLYSVAVGLAMR